MKKLPLLLLFLAFSLCSANPPKNADIDSLKDRIKVLETGQNAIKTSVDSLNSKFLSDNFISVKAAKEIEELHNTAFDKMQNSFSNFLIAISIINGILALFIGALVFINFRSVENSKKEVKEELAKIKGFENKISDMETKINEIENQKTEFENSFKEQIENQKTEVEKYKKEFEELKKWIDETPFIVAESYKSKE